MSKRAATIAVLLATLLAHAPNAHASQADDPCEERLAEVMRTRDASEFLNTRFNGASPLPPWPSITFQNPEDGRVMKVHIQKISGLSENFQNIIAYLKAESLAHPEMPFREFGGFYFHYADRPDSFVSFTSNLPTRILGDVNTEALVQEEILETLQASPEAVNVVLHFHTHPGIEYRKGTENEREDISLLPNWRDYSVYRHFATLFAKHAQRKVTFVGIVIPMCAHCDDTYFMVQVEPDQSAGRIK